jgi:hypothetical protein
MKRIANDEGGLVPLVIGVVAVAAAALGLTWYVGTSDALWQFVREMAAASILAVVGVVALMGKFILLPRGIALIAGGACLVAAVWLVLNGW